MKRGPPVRNGGPPPKRSALSGPMGRRKCHTHLNFSRTPGSLLGIYLCDKYPTFIAVCILMNDQVFYCLVFCSPHVKGQGFLWSTPSSQRLDDVQKG